MLVNVIAGVIGWSKHELRLGHSNYRCRPRASRRFKNAMKSYSSGAARRRCHPTSWCACGAITFSEEARAFRVRAQHRVSATDTNWQASGMAASGWHAEEWRRELPGGRADKEG